MGIGHDPFLEVDDDQGRFRIESGQGHGVDSFVRGGDRIARAAVLWLNQPLE